MANKDVFEQYESGVRSYCRKFPTVFSKAKGSFLYDTDGKRYIDFFCGAGGCNYGHNNDYIKRRVIEYLENDGIVHALDLYTEAKADFLAYFEEKVLAPRGLEYRVMFPGPTGTNAVEAAIKLARKVTKRTNVFALMGAFHGMTLGALALTTDMGSRGGAGVPLEHVTHIPAPYQFPELDTIQYMETLLTDDHSGVDKPAALIVESLQAEGGIHVLPEEWLRRAEALCKKHGILLILDEIQIGCGRTGTFFSFERAGIHPDIVVMAKSIGGIGMPFALTLFRPELDVWTPGEHNGTFRGFQPAIVAAKASLEFLLSEHIEEAVRAKGGMMNAYLEKGLTALGCNLPLRGLGMIWGIDFDAYPAGTAKTVSRACFDRGLVIELAGRGDCVLKLMPALTTDEETLRAGMDIIFDAIRAVLA